MEIRPYKPIDLEQIAQLFYETVHAVNIKDYTERQVNAWATGNINLKEWGTSFLKHLTYVATEKDMIIGFGDIDETGYLDRIYVHKDFSRSGCCNSNMQSTGKRNRNKMYHCSCFNYGQTFFLKKGDIIRLSLKKLRNKGFS